MTDPERAPWGSASQMMPSPGTQEPNHPVISRKNCEVKDVSILPPTIFSVSKVAASPKQMPKYVRINLERRQSHILMVESQF